MGLNLYSCAPLASRKQPACSLQDFHPHHLDRNTLLAYLIPTLMKHLEVLKTAGWLAFQAQWDAVDYLRGRWITHPRFSGKACGTSPQGALYVEDTAGQLHTLTSGDYTTPL